MTTRFRDHWPPGHISWCLKCSGVWYNTEPRAKGFHNVPPHFHAEHGYLDVVSCESCDPRPRPEFVHPDDYVPPSAADSVEVANLWKPPAVRSKYAASDDNY